MSLGERFAFGPRNEILEAAPPRLDLVIALSVRIKNGRSVTWGSFGGPRMEISGNAYLTNLNGYRPGTSVANGP